MSPDEQRIAIAQACGFSAPFDSHEEWEETSGMDGSDGFFNVLRDANGKRVPDYPNDLNAMHEAEKLLGDCEIKWRKYRDWLYAVLEPRRHEINATARQRAAALLLTLNIRIQS